MRSSLLVMAVLLAGCAERAREGVMRQDLDRMVGQEVRLEGRVGGRVGPAKLSPLYVLVAGGQVYLPEADVEEGVALHYGDRVVVEGVLEQRGGVRVAVASDPEMPPVSPSPGSYVITHARVAPVGEGK